MKKFINFYKDLSPEFKKVNFYVLLTYFLILFSYPLMRSATSAIFYEVYTAKEYSFATFIGVIVLMGIIFISNKWQTKLGIHKLYFTLGMISIFLILFSYSFFQSGHKEMAYVLFAIKESYIVLMLHTCLAFVNAYYGLEQLKRFIGPIGGVGALGGILGGQLTSFLAKAYGTGSVVTASLVFISLSVMTFFMTKDVKVKGMGTSKSITPIKSVLGVKKYVFLIAAIVGISQFVIYIADLQFNIIFEQVVETKDARTAYLGEFYSIVNFVSIVMQMLVLPYLLMRFKLKNIFFVIPLLYFLVLVTGLSVGASSLMVAASVFIVFKGTDYSIFNSVKEVMYNPLLSLQKFGAKYITDMFVYRTSKALIAFIFAIKVVKNNFLTLENLSTLQFLFLGLWVLLIILLFKEQKKLKH